MIPFLLALAVEIIPVSIGRDDTREMAYLWDAQGKLVEASGGVWAEVKGDGEFTLPPGRRIKRVWRFMATDAGSCVEGDLNITRGGVAVFLSAPHNITAGNAYDGWESTEVDYPTTGGPFSLRWVCRTTCSDHARCLMGLQLELQEERQH